MMALTGTRRYGRGARGSYGGQAIKMVFSWRGNGGQGGDQRRDDFSRCWLNVDTASGTLLFLFEGGGARGQGFPAGFFGTQGGSRRYGRA